jgi:replicative DNA helicase
MNVIHKMMMKKGEMTGAPSGFHDLDRLTFGFQRQEMIVLAARPVDGQDLVRAQHRRGGDPPKAKGSLSDAHLFAGDERRPACAAHALLPGEGKNASLARRLIVKERRRAAAARRRRGRVLEGAALHR